MTHIESLTGVQAATVNRYRTYLRRDIDPVFGSLPITAVTETTIARWVQQFGVVGRRSPTSKASCRRRLTRPRKLR